jgi:hypothetical protein
LGEAAVPTDLGGVDVKPTITKEDVAATTKHEEHQEQKDVGKDQEKKEGEADVEDGTEDELGAYPTKKAPPVPKRLYFGFSSHDESTANMTTEQIRTRSLLEEYASEAWYGTSFHK